MARDVERRLQALEQAARPALGWRCFEQDIDQPEVFHEGQGEARRAYTRDEISALGEQGWQCIVICWESVEPGAIRLAWGDA